MEWINEKKEKPRIEEERWMSEPVFAYSSQKGVLSAVYTKADEWLDSRSCVYLSDVLFWMEMPKIPENKEEAE